VLNISQAADTINVFRLPILSQRYAANNITIDVPHKNAETKRDICEEVISTFSFKIKTVPDIAPIL